MGSIYKRGKVYWIKYHRNGKPFRESTKSLKEADAKRLLKRREGEIAQGKLPGIYFDRVNFDDLAEDFLSDYRINEKKSLSAAQNNINHLSEYFGGMKVVNITTPEIHAYIEYRSIDRVRLSELLKERKSQSEIAEIMKISPSNVWRAINVVNESSRAKNGASKATINRELAALKRMLNLGAQQTPPRVDRVPHIPMLKENNVRKGFFEHGDYLALKEALPIYLRGFATFAYKTGWRVSEISKLTWDQVDLDQGIAWLEVGETKNDEGRTIYLDKELKEIFQQQWETRKKKRLAVPYVFNNEDGTDRVMDFRKSWKSACKEADIGESFFHDFRRTAVRNMVRAGVPERVAMMVSGHKTRSVFERYNIVSDTDLRLAAQKQETYLSEQESIIKVPSNTKLLRFYIFMAVLNKVMGTNSGTITNFDTKMETMGNA